MRKILAITFLILTVLVGCSGSNIDFSVKTAPKYDGEQAYPFVLEAKKGGEAIEGLALTATFEMAKMDHGEMEVPLQDKGNGLYEADVELPMAGEWIATIKGGDNDTKVETAITFNVDED